MELISQPFSRHDSVNWPQMFAPRIQSDPYISRETWTRDDLVGAKASYDNGS